MSKKELSSLDMLAIVSELKHLEGKRVSKIYQKGDSIYIRLQGQNLLAITLGGAYLTNYSTSFSKNPSGFSMLLRKHIGNSKLQSIEQHGFDRVFLFHFSGKEQRTLVAEMFRNGNIMLLDESQKILMPLRRQKWKGRTLKPHELYKFPPESSNPLKLSEKELEETLSEKKELVKVLATKLNFGGVYAEELCTRSQIDKTTQADSLIKKDITSLHKTIEKILKEAASPKPHNREGRPYPIKVSNSEKSEFKTFNEAVDKYFSADSEEISEEELRQSKILKKQKEQVSKLLTDSKTFREQADELSKKGEFEKSGELYEKSKKSKGKIDGLLKSIKKTEKNLGSAKKKAEKEAPVLKEPVKREWYEKFRWFISSDGFLIIGGKDATTNEIIIKKHTEPKDLVFHADVTGAPFCVVKTSGTDSKDIPKTTLSETAEFAVSYSKAWQRGLGAADVYWVHPEQVSKSAPSGEHIGKGAFMIRGKKNYFRNTELKIAVGITKTWAVVGGPEKSVENQSKYFSVIIPGPIKSSDIAKKAKASWIKKASKEDSEKLKNIKLDEIQRFIPTGKGGIHAKSR
ncbi:TPA: NFACT family protein [archaeon]|jgi:predicted ribosome quality control (RQC) complex YloA/Tae2 family protein|uniref:NFACT family protein n=1 Tax=Candidatus Undinarchaeum marinum TaxID=2756141 RepID=A0A832ULM3_9ARCH|nr:NFACT family protein [Candidatus Undinarchaeum marinum]